MAIYKVICMLSACLVLLTTGGCSPQSSNSLGSATLNVPTYAVKAPVAGKLLGLISEKGERISKGQPLFAVSAEAVDDKAKDITTQLAKAEADLKRMEIGTSASAPIADLSAAQANVTAAQQKAAKMNSLLAQGAVSRNQAQAAQNEPVAATAALQAASSTAVQTRPASPEQIAAQKKLVEQLKQQKAAVLTQQQQNEGVSPCTASSPSWQPKITTAYKRIRSFCTSRPPPVAASRSMSALPKLRICKMVKASTSRPKQYPLPSLGRLALLMAPR